jgi:hypothetical protein
MAELPKLSNAVLFDGMGELPWNEKSYVLAELGDGS